MDRIRVLFLCGGNSARSQMAEALLRKHAGHYFDVYSAGLEPSEVNPFTIKVLREAGVDTSNLKSKSLTSFMGKMHFGFLITVCSRAENNCPIFPGMGMRLHWPFDDPAVFKGTPDETTDVFRTTRDQIEVKILDWLITQGVMDV